MNKVLNLTYASSLTKLCEINSSFDTGILRIAYAGKNRNGSFISKETFEKCIKTIYNCPIVCNYDRESDSLGGHDIEVVRNSSGDLKIVNLTTPVGCVPESSKYWWETIEEDDGEKHDYLCVEVLLWKRQEAYSKIKEDGITSHSMEITVKDGEFKDGVYYIYDFEFTAFALIGVEPCFESSSLEMFSKKEFKNQLSEMVKDLKNFGLINTSTEVDDIHPQEHSTEGGNKILDEKMNLLNQNETDTNSQNFSTETQEDVVVEETKEDAKEFDVNTEKENVSEQVNEPISESKFELTENIISEIRRKLEEATIEKEWGEFPKYWYVDSDFELKEVYCWDSEDWLLYGFGYSIDGDSITIDYESKKRKKFAIMDFDEGEQPSPLEAVFQDMSGRLCEAIEFKTKYNSATEQINSLSAEIGELKQFKAGVEESVEKEKRDKLFESFADLEGLEAFEQLKESSVDYDIETLEEKCYAIRGRSGKVAKFSNEQKTPKLKIEKTNTAESDEPYGDLFTRYGHKLNQ